MVKYRINHDKIYKFLKAHGNKIMWAECYGEPGYGESDKGILFANWNNFHDQLPEVLEQAGFEIEWSDEWHIDDESFAWRTEPDGLFWECSIRFFDGYVLTPNDDPSNWIDACLGSRQHATYVPLPHCVDVEYLLECGWNWIPNEDSEDGDFHLDGEFSTADLWEKLKSFCPTGFFMVLREGRETGSIHVFIQE